MKISRIFAVSAASFFLIGCYIGPTPYVEGVVDYSLDSNRKMAGFYGNGYTSKSRAHRFVLLHAAEVCDASGFTHFIVLNSGDYSTIHTHTTPTRTEYEYNQWTKKVEATTYGGQTSSYEKPAIELSIMCLDVANRQHRAHLREAYDCAPLLAQMNDAIRNDEERIREAKEGSIKVTGIVLGATLLLTLIALASES